MNPSKSIVNEWISLVKAFVKEEGKTINNSGRQLKVVNK